MKRISLMLIVVVAAACSNNKPNIKAPEPSVPHREPEPFIPTLYEPHGELLEELQQNNAQGFLGDNNKTIVVDKNAPLALVAVDGKTQYPFWSSINQRPQNIGIVKIEKDGANKVKSIVMHDKSGQKTFAYNDNLVNLSGKNYRAALADVGVFSQQPKQAQSIATLDSKTVNMVLKDPQVANWNYQTFAFIKQNLAQQQLDKKLEAGDYYAFMSIGTATLPKDLPSEKIGVYQGFANGLLIADKKQYQTNAKVILKADFGRRKGAFETHATKIYPITTAGLGKAIDAEALNLSTGTEAFSWQKNQVNFKTLNLKSRLGFRDDGCKNKQHCFVQSGELAGRFYGGKAAEVGGVFSLRQYNSKTKTHSSYSGAFGAKRQ